MSQTSTEAKITLRAQAKQRRAKLNTAAISAKIRNLIALWPCFQQADLVYAFAALSGEIDLLPLVAQFPDKHWFLPRMVSDEAMVFHRYHDGESLQDHPFGVPEPWPHTSLVPRNKAPDLVFIPCLMVDRNGIRLGFGKGYYDRFLKTLPSSTITACPIPHELFTDTLPQDPWDIPVQWALTENELIDLEKPSSSVKFQ